MPAYGSEYALVVHPSASPAETNGWQTGPVHLFENRTTVRLANAYRSIGIASKAIVYNKLARLLMLDATLRRWRSMNVNRTLGALFLATSLVGALPAQADSVSGSMQVSVQVIARAVVTVDSQPASVTITPEDLARGYIDLDAPILVHVRTNSRRGYLLQVNNVSDAFTSVELSSGDMTMNVAQESWIQRPYVSGGDLMPVHARLHLARGMTAGTAQVAIAFNATPL